MARINGGETVSESRWLRTECVYVLQADNIDTVKYQAFLRKQTRYNPTRGGKPFAVFARITHICLLIPRPFPLPCSL